MSYIAGKPIGDGVVIVSARLELKLFDRKGNEVASPLYCDIQTSVNDVLENLDTWARDNQVGLQALLRQTEDRLLAEKAAQLRAKAPRKDSGFPLSCVR